MITPDWVRLMAAYNAEMNRRLYAAAATLDDAARRQERGAFWRSIHGTLAHLLWGDRTWMHRLDGWPETGVALRDSAGLLPEFAPLSRARQETDAGIAAWAARMDEAFLARDLTWFSGAMGRELSRPMPVIVTHMFNHQTHHRGQAHAMLTAAGAATGDTDLPFILPFP